MTDRKIPKNEWRVYFDEFSKAIAGRRVEMEVIGLDLGDQIQEEWTLLQGLSFDPKDDILFVHTLGLEHQIRNPQEIYTQELGTSLNAVGVKDREGHMQVVKLRQPLMLGSTHA